MITKRNSLRLETLRQGLRDFGHVSPREIIEGHGKLLKEFYLFLGFPEAAFEVNLRRFADTSSTSCTSILLKANPPLDAIRDACEATWGMSSDAYLMVNNRKSRGASNMVKGRKSWILNCYYLLSIAYTDRTLEEIGALVGVTHPNVSIVARGTAAGLLESDPNFLDFYNKCRLNLAEMII